MRRCSPTRGARNIHYYANDAAISISLRLALIDAWLTAARDAFAKASGVAPEDLTINEHTAATLLDLARIAAHTSGRRQNAPLLSFLAGIAVARGADIDDLAEGDPPPTVKSTRSRNPAHTPLPALRPAVCVHNAHA